MERPDFSQEELEALVDKMIEESDVLVRRALSRILELIREEQNGTSEG